MAIDTPVAVGSVSIQGNDYPVYGTQARALEYLRASLTGEVFTAESFTLQIKSLITARRWIDRQSFKGEKTGGSSQFTKFPRSGETTVPLNVEFAQYELTLVLIEDNEAANNRNTGSNERVLQAGPARIEFFSRTDGGGGVFSGEGVFPPQALDLLSPYLVSKAAIIAPFAGGLGNKSNVLGVTQFGLNEPL